MNTLKMDRSQITETMSHETIRARAYELYLARGREPGHEQQDWLQAEQELMVAATVAPVAREESEETGTNTSKKEQRGEQDGGRAQRGSNGQRPSQRH